jgi:hypothetical protein
MRADMDAAAQSRALIGEAKDGTSEAGRSKCRRHEEGFGKELRWSPSGTYLAYGFVTYTSRGVVTGDTVYRIPYSGGTGIALTKDLTWCEPRGWPQGE